MTAVAQFSCRTNSHPFQDRHVSLTEPAKIGRSVARCRPTANNAVFDCKVLSRNHALLWYENGKFYLQDTRSSNGTFVNNQRLSKASEKSPAVEVNSCDIVQFGVDVVDNTRKVTHGCIVSQLRLYLPNGEECKQSNCAWNNQIMEKVPFNNVYPTVQAQDLHQLHQYLQEALHREQMLERKLALLQRLVLSSHDASEKGWQALIDEDRLLSRLEFLENQLQAFNKTQDEDTLQSQLQQIQEEKFNYENTYKETLRQALQEKLEAAQKLSNVERSLSNTEDECTHLRHLYEQAQNDMSNQALSHQTKVEEISEKIQAADRQLSESKSVAEKQGLKMQKEIDDLVQNENMLNQAIESLKEENNRLQDEASQLHQIQMQLDQVSSEKAEEQKSRIAAEKEVLKFQEEKDRQNTALTETSRELLAALSDRENLIEREEKLRSVVEESEHMLKLCQSTSESESEERLEENKITSESFVIFKAKLKELKEQLRESNKCLENVQEENIILKEELAASKEIASIIPQLQNKLVTLQSELHNREQECVYLSAQVKQAEQSVHDIQQEMMSLKGKLVEEQKAIAKNSTLTEELRENCTTQALQIEKACKQEKETLSQLSVVKEQLTLKESEVHSLKEELMACSDLKDALLSKTDSLTDSLMEFEHEKITISDELQGLRVEKEKMQEALSTEIEQNESYRELSIKEHGKWDSVLQQKDEELKQLAEQCQELIQECKINSQKLEKSFFGRRVMLLTLMIVAVSFFYFFLFANHTPQQPS